MDALLTQAGELLLSQGLAGVVIMAMGFWIYKQQKVLQATQDKRVEDAVKFAEATHVLSAALERNTETMKAFQE